MATITHDGQSFLIDNRRIWLVSGSVHYPRTPHELWRHRLRAAKQAGLNCIDTYVFWNVHEPQPGVFRFDGDADLRRFVEMIGEEGMWCILRPGPYVCSEWDFGGLPAWLHEEATMALRQSNPAFLQACARYLDAVVKQVLDLQITHDGPILMMQNENEWFCSNDEEGERYLKELSRYMREAGCGVPLINCNGLWQPVEGTIDCWNGWNRLLDNVRQLRIAQPDAPRLVTELWPGWFDAWGRPHDSGKSPQQVMRTLAEVSAAGAQYNLYMFHGGTNFGFHGGRTVGGPDVYMTTSYDYDAPLLEAGGRGPKYKAVKRINMFLSQFGALMSHLHPREHHTIPAGGLAAIQQSGAQGDVVFIRRDDLDDPAEVELLTPRGQRLTVHLGDELAAWIALRTNLGGAAVLDLTNLRPWAFVNQRMLVLYAPAGSPGIVSIDGATMTCDVPTGMKPHVKTLQDITVVVLNEKQVDAAYIHKDGTLYVGIGGFDEDNQPIRDGHGSYTLVRPSGRTNSKRFGAKAEAPTSPRLGAWRCATVNEYITGEAPRYAAIDGPRNLEACGADYGYGWYRVRIHLPRARRVKLFAPEANDRLHLFIDGRFDRTIGFGPGARYEPLELSLGSGTHDLVFLADNLGRFNYGGGLGEKKGLFGHLLHAKAVRLKAPSESVEPAADPFELTAFAHHCRRGDRTRRPRYRWTVPHRRQTPLILVLSGDRPPMLLTVNGQPVAVDGGRGLVSRYVLTQDGCLKRGHNRMTLAALSRVPEGFDPARAVAMYEGEVLSEGAAWSYARWRMPDESQFADLPSRLPALPTWFGTTFRVKANHVPLWFEATGLTKGQIYLNGHNVGRYFVQTATGAKVPPQKRYYLPEPWLNVAGENELIVFDEHGRVPTKCRLAYDALGPYRNWR